MHSSQQPDQSSDAGAILQGVGLGLRTAHLHDVLRESPPVPWFEVHSCNYLGGGLNRALLRRIADHYPLSFHGVSLNLGGVAPLDLEYLKKLKQLVSECEPAMVSDHACFTEHDGVHFHDLLPIPFNDAAVQQLADRVSQVQDTLGRQILIENLSQYYHYPESDMTEAQFLAAVSKRSGCGLLLDINNAYVNQKNMGVDPYALFEGLSDCDVQEIHLAGHRLQDNGLLLDTHDGPVSDPVLALFIEGLAIFPNVPCLIEWDSQLPSLAELVQERDRVARVRDEALDTMVAMGQLGPDVTK